MFILFLRIFLVFGFFSGSSMAQGNLELEDGSHQSGIGSIHGWVCNAKTVSMKVNGNSVFDLPYGSSRADTQTICGDSNNGFDAVMNWNLLGDGQHTVTVLADGVEFGRAVVTVTTIGGKKFVDVPNGAFTLTTKVTIDGVIYNLTYAWSKAHQNTVLIGAEVVDSRPPTPPTDFISQNPRISYSGGSLRIDFKDGVISHLFHSLYPTKFTYDVSDVSNFRFKGDKAGWGSGIIGSLTKSPTTGEYSVVFPGVQAGDRGAVSFNIKGSDNVGWLRLYNMGTHLGAECDNGCATTAEADFILTQSIVH